MTPKAELLRLIVVLGDDEHLDHVWQSELAESLTDYGDLAPLSRAAFKLGYDRAVRDVIELLDRAVDEVPV